MPTPIPTVLVVEDEPITRSQLTSYFEAEGFNVLALDNGDQVADTIARENIDLLLLDINLPGKDGLTLTRELRVNSSVGIILVTGKDEQVDRIVGLESGADDYVTKPFDPRELLSRSRNLLRRVQAQQAQRELNHVRRFEGWALNMNTRALTAPSTHTVSLSAGEFQLLLALLDNAGQVMTRDQLMNRIRNRQWYPDDRYIDVLVGQIRKKFRREDADNKFITTIHGSGYLFAPQVS